MNYVKRKTTQNPNLRYFNVQLLGISGSGIPHPAIRNITDSRDAYMLKAHLKFLTGDILNSAILSRDNGGDQAVEFALQQKSILVTFLLTALKLLKLAETSYPNYSILL